jgi:hypothetical protein
MGGKGSGRKSRGHRAMTSTERSQRSRLGLPKLEKQGPAFVRFEQVMRETLPYVRPEAPRWFRGKRPLEITLGRKSHYA